MKKVIALLCSTVVTFTLCTSVVCAEAVLIQPSVLISNQIPMSYRYNELSAGLFYRNALASIPTIPSISTSNFDASDNRFGYSSTQVVNNHNSFFEFSIMFNDKLQQLIAFFTRSNDASSSGDSSTHTLAGNQSMTNCTD